MPKLDLTRAVRIKTARGDVSALKVGPAVWHRRVLSVTAGTGYAGSTYTCDLPGQWYADGVALTGVTGTSWVMPLAFEGAAIRCENSNVIQMWTPRVRQSDILFWVDPMDAAMLTLVNNTIVEIMDKAGSGAKFVQDIASVAPLLVQDGTRAYISPNNGLYMTASGINLASPEKLRVSVLAGDNAANTSQQRALLGQDGGFLIGRGFDGAQALGAFVRSPGGLVCTSGASWSMNRIVDFIVSATGATARSPVSADVEMSGNFRADTSLAWLFRGYQSGSTTARFWVGTLREMIIWSDDMAGQDARIQGYLAHRWGMADVLLPANHPYKTTAPRAA